VALLRRRLSLSATCEQSRRWPFLTRRHPDVRHSAQVAERDALANELRRRYPALFRKALLAWNAAGLRRYARYSRQFASSAMSTRVWRTANRMRSGMK
jgi:hypothetical protein